MKPQNSLTARFSVVNLGTPGEQVALSPLGAVAVGYALKPGYIRTPNGSKTRLPEGLLPYAMTSKGTIGGQLSNRAVVFQAGKVDILFPDQAVQRQTTVGALTDTGLMLFGRSTESEGPVGWNWALVQGEKELTDNPAALAEDGWYVTRDTSAPERVWKGKRQKLIGLAGQDWTNATHIARGGLACGYTESSGPGYVNAVWWDLKGGVHRLAPPGYGGKDKGRTWYGTRTTRINARGDVLGRATLEGKWPVGLRTAICQQSTELEILWPRGGKPVILNDLFLRSPYGRLVAIEGLADNGTLLVRTKSSKQEQLLLLKPK